MLRASMRVFALLTAGAALSMLPGGALVNAGAATTDAGPPRFVTRCTFSHRAGNDPIVYFGRRGASHTHDFFGNRTTNAFSVYRTLSRGTSTCHNALDRSAYWTPSLRVNGRFVNPIGMSAYYSSNGKPHADVRPPPSGLKVVAGSASATTPQGFNITSWSCGDDGTLPESSDVPKCPLGTLLLHVNFPDCWDGINLDSADHKSHLTYHRKGGDCPPTHPVPIPRLRLNVIFPTTGGPDSTLASAGQYSGHADFFNVWNQQEIRRLVTTCINAGLSCNVNA